MTSVEHSDYYVYILFDENAMPFYVGKGRKDRWVSHHAKSKRIGLRGSKINEVFNILGELPKIKLQENLTNKEALDLEAMMIFVIGRGKNGPLVNHTDGGECGPGLLPEEAAKLKGQRISAAKKGKVIISDEQKQKISKALTGRKLSEATIQKKKNRKLSESHLEKLRQYRHTPEHIQKMKDSKTGKPMPKGCAEAAWAATTGKPLSEEHKLKLSQSLLGRKFPKRKKRPPMSEDQKIKRSLALKGKPQRKRGPMSDAEKLKRSIALKGRSFGNNVKRNITDVPTP